MDKKANTFFDSLKHHKQIKRPAAFRLETLRGLFRVQDVLGFASSHRVKTDFAGSGMISWRTSSHATNGSLSVPPPARHIYHDARA